MAKDITVDMSSVEGLVRDLRRFNDRAFPFATKQTVNEAAFDARLNWREEIEDKMIERNKFTKNSIRVETTRTLDVRRQIATVGSIAPYMDEQEFGGVKARKGKQGVPLATSYAAGQGEGSKPRTRLPRASNTLRKIKLNRGRIRAKGRAQRNFVAVREASKRSTKHVYLDTGRRRGIYRVVGKGKNARPKLVYDLSESSVRIPRNPTMGPAVDRTTRILPGIYRGALMSQLKRHKILGY